MKTYFFLVFLLFTCNLFSQPEDKAVTCEVSVSESLKKSTNDKIVVDFTCPISKFKFQLFNRWGQLLYETEIYSTPLNFDIHERMKGKRKKPGPEKYTPSNTYFWIVEYTHAENGFQGKSTGNLRIDY